MADILHAKKYAFFSSGRWNGKKRKGVQYCEHRGASLQTRASFHSHMRDFKQRDIPEVMEFFMWLIVEKKCIFDHIFGIRDGLVMILFDGLFHSQAVRYTNWLSVSKLTYQILNQNSSLVLNLQHFLQIGVSQFFFHKISRITQEPLNISKIWYFLIEKRHEAYLNNDRFDLKHMFLR